VQGGELVYARGYGMANLDYGIAITPQWLKDKAANSLALATGIVLGIDRFVLVPRAQEAWSKVDLVASRPLENLELAQAHEQAHDAAIYLAAGLLTTFLIYRAVREHMPWNKTDAPQVEAPAATTPGPAVTLEKSDVDSNAVASPGAVQASADAERDATSRAA